MQGNVTEKNFLVFKRLKNAIRLKSLIYQLQFRKVFIKKSLYDLQVS